MEEIIVGIDFSRGSECAIELGIDIANRMKQDMKLVYVISESDDGKSLEKDIESKIKALISKYSPMLLKTKMT
ncbi:MAG: universal stress protein, partial [Bacteroidales bacterium]|nr:universal stress protein [Bacteroidales bacterium]